MIQIKNLTKKYEDTIVFNQANYNFPDKGLVCLLGSSGCGKSTLLNLIAGFDSQYSGQIIVGNTSIHDLSRDELCAYRYHCIGFIFQEYHLLSGYSVKENILISNSLKKSTATNNLKTMDILLEKVGLLDKQNQKIENLSGGQKQRVAIVRALMENPDIILADEPTGALDRANSNEVMRILKEIAKERLVVVITHDNKICSYADEIITIENGQILSENRINQINENKSISLVPIERQSIWKRSIKNFKVHFKKYFIASLAISIAICCFILSLSFGNIMETSVDQFKEKNSAFNNGYVKIKEDNTDKVFNILQADERIENVYKQYKLSNISLVFNEKIEVIEQKYPMPKAVENMAYGTMPKIGMNEIALSPSLAKKFMNNINELIGKEIKLIFNGHEFKLIVSGIYGAEYDDFYISADLDKTLMEQVDETCYSISYDVRDFKDVVVVNQALEKSGIESKTAVKEVEAFLDTFNTIRQLFSVITILIFMIGLFLSVILLFKLQNSRYKEVGLLSALGFTKKAIGKMIVGENILLSFVACSFNALWLSIIIVVSKFIKFNLIIKSEQIIYLIISTFLIVIGVGLLTSYQLIRTEPAVALRK